MPLFFLLVGIALVVSGAKGTTKELATLLKDDFTGTPPTFGIWAVAIILCGTIGYAPKLKPISNGFLALVFVSLFLSNKGFFANFRSALKI